MSDVAGVDAWVISIREKLKGVKINGVNEKICIYRVPEWLKDHVCDGNDKTPYEPEIISFGPYHRGKTGVPDMENHKWRCLKSMLVRTDLDITPFLVAMKDAESDVRACYEKPLPEINSNDFVQMLILDGCFMLEFLQTHKYGVADFEYKADDPIFSKATITHAIARDMIKLENQLPLMVLEKLLAIQFKGRPIRKLVSELVLYALAPVWVTNEILGPKQLKILRKAVANDAKSSMLHCLDAFRSSLLYDHSPATAESNIVAVETNDDDVPLPDQNETNGDDVPLPDQNETNGDDVPLPDENKTNSDDVPLPVQNDKETLNCSRNLGELMDCESQEGYEAYDSCSSFDSDLDSDLNEPQHPPNLYQRQLMSFLANVIDKSINCGRRPPLKNGSIPTVGQKSVLRLEEGMNKAISYVWRRKLAYENISGSAMVNCVENLREAGVNFKTRNCKPFWDLRFDEHKGLLEIPPVMIDDATKTVFLNLIAYEQCHLGNVGDMRITDYVAFMDKLVNSGGDVGHLHEAGIIDHQLGSDVEVAELFNRLGKKVVFDSKRGKLSELYLQLNKFCSHRRHRWCASLRHVYFNNPWVIISIVAASLLFLVTVTQTIYTILAYHKPPK